MTDNNNRKGKVDSKKIRMITLGAFLHDDGKFAERSGIVEPGDKDEVQSIYRYAHAYHTEQVLERLYPNELCHLRIDGQDADATVLNLAARHHKPCNVWEQIIQQADQIASSSERETSDSCQEIGGRERKKKTRLLNLLSRVRKNPPADNEEDFTDHYFRIRPFFGKTTWQDFNQLFPVSETEYGPNDAEKDYFKHWEAFESELRALQLDPVSQFETIFGLYRKYQWCLPASTRREDLPDVSLFEHGKATAALAACLYYYHAENNSLRVEAIRNRELEKYILFCGDISGIQKFIYQISSKGAYRTLKGKSFFIQLLCEILARKILDEFSLTVANLLYASGGKFYLLLPNTETVTTALEKVCAAINKELFESYNGDLFLRTASRAMTGLDLSRESGNTIGQIWEELGRSLIYSDRRRMSAFAQDNYDRIFGVRSQELTSSCEVCHASIKQTDLQCAACKAMGKLGAELRDARFVVLGRSVTAVPGSPPVIKNLCGWSIWCLDRKPEFMGNDAQILIIDPEKDIPDVIPDCGSRVNATYLPVGSNHRFDVDFKEVAKKSEGIERLGILRMDVDGLGLIFSQGLINYRHKKSDPEKRQFQSLAQITTMSSLLSVFFSAVMPALIENRDDWRERVTVVYSGGDDLFILGAWDAIPEVAIEIQRLFSVFCKNPDFTLSGGMVVTGGGFPVYKSAELAGDAESMAKKNKTIFTNKRGEVEKESFTFLGEAMHWQEFDALNTLRRKLEIIVSQPANKTLLNRIREIAFSWEDSRQVWARQCQTGKISKDAVRGKMMAEAWRWRMVYSFSRFGERNPELMPVLNDLQSFALTQVAQTRRIGIELFPVLSRWLELISRKKDHS